MNRVLAILVLMAALSLPAAAESPDTFRFIEAHCAACHSPPTKAGGLDLTALRSPKTFQDDRAVWEKVAQKLKLREMPPAGLPRPPAEITTGVVRWLESEFER